MITAARTPLAYALTMLSVLVALLLLGFGHTAQANHAPLDPSARAFIEAGGQLSDVCVDATDQEIDLSACPVCQLVKGFDMPEVSAGCAVMALHVSPVIWHHVAAQHPPQRPDLGHSSRAPPIT